MTKHLCVKLFDKMEMNLNIRRIKIYHKTRKSESDGLGAALAKTGNLVIIKQKLYIFCHYNDQKDVLRVVKQYFAIDKIQLLDWLVEKDLNLIRGISIFCLLSSPDIFRFLSLVCSNRFTVRVCFLCSFIIFV